MRSRNHRQVCASSVARDRSSLISGRGSDISTVESDVPVTRARAGLLLLQPSAQGLVVPLRSLACHQAVRHLCHIITSLSSRSRKHRCVPHVVSSQQTHHIHTVAADVQQDSQLQVGQQVDQYHKRGFFPPASCIPQLLRACAYSAISGPLCKGIRFVVGAVPIQLNRLDGSTASLQVQLLILHSWSQSSPRYGLVTSSYSRPLPLPHRCRGGVCVRC